MPIVLDVLLCLTNSFAYQTTGSSVLPIAMPIVLDVFLCLTNSFAYQTASRLSELVVVHHQRP